MTKPEPYQVRRICGLPPCCAPVRITVLLLEQLLNWGAIHARLERQQQRECNGRGLMRESCQTVLNICSTRSPQTLPDANHEQIGAT